MDVFGRDLLKWMNFVTLPIISKGDLSQQPILVPPLKEQGSISGYLDEQMKIYLSTITKENRRVELLSEYRQSLISSVVTGKVRVAEDMI
jgi:type I restriction enzyme S subunit